MSQRHKGMESSCRFAARAESGNLLALPLESLSIRELRGSALKWRVRSQISGRPSRGARGTTTAHSGRPGRRRNRAFAAAGVKWTSRRPQGSHGYTAVL